MHFVLDTATTVTWIIGIAALWLVPHRMLMQRNCLSGQHHE